MQSSKPKQTIGVCYYPEHWPESLWEDDARRMCDLGIEYVRIGEFAWSKLEPKRGYFQFEWLDRAIQLLGSHGLKIILGTPTATPPKWLVNEMPDMLPVDAQGNVRGFGSRRHYSFAHEGYRKESARIVEILAKRYGSNEHIVAWQTDNEYDCHDTVLSFSEVDLKAFRNWLGQKYQSCDALNRAWGNVFWSMEYTSFDEIELPINAVTEINPAHLMDYRRFASDMVVEFNKLQCNLIRKYAVGRDIVHNFMGRILAFDHYEVGRDLDVSSWDSYPLGFLEDRNDLDEAHKQVFFRAGDPDFQALHHDLYRSINEGRWWIMEQQPGPVNWAPHNPIPRAGMVTLWTLEAFAHGAELVSYFRWRQAPFAQEQMHTGLLGVDNKVASGYLEAEQAVDALKTIGPIEQAKADVVIVFDYPSAWAWEVQPQGKEFDYFRLVFDLYRALRAKGLNVDFTPAANPDLDNRKLVFVPALFAWNDGLLDAVKNCDAEIVIGPRSGSKTPDFKIPTILPPNLPEQVLDIEVKQVETLRSDCAMSVFSTSVLQEASTDKLIGQVQFWRENLKLGGHAKSIFEYEDGSSAFVKQGNIYYLSGWADQMFFSEIIQYFEESLSLGIADLPYGVRTRKTASCEFLFNYSNQTHDLSFYAQGRKKIFGDEIMQPSGILVLA